MKKEVLEKSYKILDKIDVLNNNKNYYEEVINNNLFISEDIFNCVRGILKEPLYFYSLNNNGYENIMKFVKYYNNQELNNLLFNSCKISKTIDELKEEVNKKDIINLNDKLFEKYNMIDNIDIIYNVYLEFTDQFYKTEKKLVNYLLGNKNLKDELISDVNFTYVLINFINKYKSIFNINDVKELIQLINTIPSLSMFKIKNYLNINVVNNIYTDVDINNIDFYNLVLDIFAFIKEKDFAITLKNGKVISDSALSNNKIVFTEDDINKLPSVLNYIVSSEHFCFCLDSIDLKRIYDLINYCRFDIEKKDDKRFMFCNEIIKKSNNLNLIQEQVDRGVYNNKDNSFEVCKELRDISYLYQDLLVNCKDFEQFRLYNIHSVERCLIKYLIDSQKISSDKEIYDILCNNPIVDLAIIYILNDKLELLNKHHLELLSSLIRVRIKNVDEIKRRKSSNIKPIHSYKKLLKTLDDFVNNSCVFD